MSCFKRWLQKWTKFRIGCFFLYSFFRFDFQEHAKHNYIDVYLHRLNLNLILFIIDNFCQITIIKMIATKLSIAALESLVSSSSSVFSTTQALLSNDSMLQTVMV